MLNNTRYYPNHKKNSNNYGRIAGISVTAYEERSKNSHGTDLAFSVKENDSTTRAQETLRRSVRKNISLRLPMFLYFYIASDHPHENQTLC